MTEQGATRLQGYIQDVKRSGKSWKEIGSTLRSYMEKGVPPNPQDGPLSRLDGLMRWQPGSARDVLQGGDPTPVDEAVVNDQAIALMRRAADLAAEAADLMERGR